jgi:hypothetical protein
LVECIAAKKLPHRQVQQLLAKCNLVAYNHIQSRYGLAVPSEKPCKQSADPDRSKMRRCLANVMLAGLGLALPLWAFGQTTTIPVIPALQPPAHAKKDAAKAPVWQRDGNTLSVTATGHAAPTIPTATPQEGQSHSASAGVHFTSKPGITAHANVREVRWAPLAPACAEALSGAPLNPVCINPLAEGVQGGEVGAGFAGPAGKFDVSVGQSHSASTNSSALDRRAALPRVLPAEGGADVAAP